MPRVSKKRRFSGVPYRRGKDEKQQDVSEASTSGSTTLPDDNPVEYRDELDSSESEVYHQAEETASGRKLKNVTPKSQQFLF